MQKILNAFCLLVLLTSCSNLSHINTFTSESALAVRKYNDITFSAESYCRDFYCMDARTYVTGLIAMTPGCDCKDFNNADKSVAAINDILTDYFSALGKLTTSGAGKIRVTGLARSVTELRVNAKLGLSEGEVALVKDLATEVAGLLAGSYKRAQLKSVFENTHISIGKAIDVQKNNIHFLRAMLATEKNELLAGYSSLSEKTNDAGLKFLLGSALASKNKRMDKQDMELELFSKTLERIAKGHEKLYDNRLSLKNAVFRKMIIEEALVLNELLQDYEALQIN